METLIDFFGIQNLMPHGYCLSWNPVLLWLHVASDILIALSYYSIPLSLAYFVRKRKDLPYAWLILMFGLFIVACGTTHLMSAVLIWIPLYWFDGYLKVFTAIISVATAIAMLRIIPLALKLPSAEQLQREINERKVAELAAQEASNRLHKIANQLPNVVFQFQMRVDGSFCIPYSNEVLRDIYHVSPEEVHEDAALIFANVHPDDLASHIEKIKMSAQNLSQWRDEYRLKFEDGTVRWLAGNALPQREADGSTLWHGFVEDITERKQIDVNFQKERDKTLALLRNASDGITILSDKGNLIECSDSFCTMLGYSREEIIGMHVSQWEVGVPKNEIMDIVTAQFKQPTRAQFESRHLRKDGTIYNTEISGCPIEFDGEWVLFNSTRDVTKRKYAEQALKDISEELQRSNADLEQFAYAVSHDMRQPLRMVTSYLSLIESALEDKLDEDTRQFLTFAVDGAKRMDSMILSLLDYSRVGRKTESLTVISSRAAVDEAILFLKVALETSGGKVEIVGDWIDLVANRDELTRLFQNLIGNALKYHEENKPPFVNVCATVIGKTFRVEVRDNGIGIAPNQLDRLFKVFSRLQSRSRFEGTGVGLALCRKIVEHHGGHCGVTSEGEGFGCVFWFELPIKKLVESANEN
jgi:PAS domain S-box-containing protein